MRTNYTRTPLDERLWRHVDKTDTCWLWTGGTNHTDGSGYGSLGVRDGTGRQYRVYAHRLSWELNNGPIPTGGVIMHTCDTPRCVRPEHLQLGTQADNMRDAVEKGRMEFGDRHWTRRFPDRAIEQLRNIRPDQRARGERHGSRTQPERVARGERVGSARFTAETIQVIRDRYARGGITQRELGAEYGAHQAVISNIVLRKRWRHI